MHSESTHIDCFLVEWHLDLPPLFPFIILLTHLDTQSLLLKRWHLDHVNHCIGCGACIQVVHESNLKLPGTYGNNDDDAYNEIPTRTCCLESNVVIIPSSSLYGRC